MEDHLVHVLARSGILRPLYICVTYRPYIAHFLVSVALWNDVNFATFMTIVLKILLKLDMIIGPV